VAIYAATTLKTKNGGSKESFSLVFLEYHKQHSWEQISKRVSWIKNSLKNCRNQTLRLSFIYRTFFKN
jgi:hypothetical protein